MSLGYTWRRQVTRAHLPPSVVGPDRVTSDGMCAWRVPICVYVLELSCVSLPHKACEQGWVASQRVCHLGSG